MNLGLKQEVNMNQKLFLTLKMQQSLNILQMPIIELMENISNELNENPLLETVSDDPINHNDIFEEYSYKLYKNLLLDYNYDKNNPNYEEIENPINYIQEKKTLTDFLMEQSGYLKEPYKVIKIIHYIIQNIDERGYFPYTDIELAKELNISIESAEYAIKKVQDFTPDGIAARDLKECLIIQLKKRNITDKILYEMINSHLELIGKNKIKEVATKLKISKTDTYKYFQILKTLEPKPSRGFYSDAEVYIIPDAYIARTGEELIITINDNMLPRLRLMNCYKDIINNSIDEKTKEYIKGKLNSAIYLIKNIEERKATLVKVLEEIVAVQRNYFLYGEKYLKQMSMKEIANSIHMHESTVSRAIKGKYIQTPEKIIKLKDLFTTGLSNSENNLSATVLKKEIYSLISQENKRNTFSDQEISEILSEKGIFISRRTVAKYRESMGIKSSLKRRIYI